MRFNFAPKIIIVIIALISIISNPVFSSEDKATFDSYFYYHTYPDLALAGYTESNVQEHWEQFGSYEGRQGSSTFNVVFYLQKYQDLQQAFGNDYNSAKRHYIEYGIYEGRQGSSTFDVIYYLQNNLDLQQAFGNNYHAATLHWINHGIYEGRHGIEPSDTYTELIRFGSFGRDCDLPSLSSVNSEVVDGQSVTTFTLQNGAIGGCTNDNTSRNGAPYYERAELKQTDTLSKTQRHIITFSIKIYQGFEGRRETFFQVHNWNTSYTEAAPSIMLGWNYGKLFLSVLKANLDDHNNLYELYSKPISEFRNDWHQIRIAIEKIQDERSSISLLIDNELIASYLTTYFPDRGTPHIKHGIYRPGNDVTPIETSVISFGDIQIMSTD